MNSAKQLMRAAGEAEPGRAVGEAAASRAAGEPAVLARPNPSHPTSDFSCVCHSAAILHEHP